MFIHRSPSVESPRDLFCKKLAWGGALGKEVTHEDGNHTHIYIWCMFLLHKDNHSPFSAFVEGTLAVSVPNSLFGGRGLGPILSSFPFLWNCSSVIRRKCFRQYNSVEWKKKAPWLWTIASRFRRFWWQGYLNLQFVNVGLETKFASWGVYTTPQLPHVPTHKYLSDAYGCTWKGILMCTLLPIIWSKTDHMHI